MREGKTGCVKGDRERRKKCSEFEKEKRRDRVEQEGREFKRGRAKED